MAARADIAAAAAASDYNVNDPASNARRVIGITRIGLQLAIYFLLDGRQKKPLPQSLRVCHVGVCVNLTT
jgi:hypothetical protein